VNFTKLILRLNKHKLKTWTQHSAFNKTHTERQTRSGEQNCANICCQELLALFYGPYIGQHALARTHSYELEGFVGGERSFTARMPCWQQLAHSDEGEDTWVLLDGVTCTVSILSGWLGMVTESRPELETVIKRQPVENSQSPKVVAAASIASFLVQYKLATTLRDSQPGVQSASLIMTSLMTS